MIQTSLQNSLWTLQVAMLLCLKMKIMVKDVIALRNSPSHCIGSDKKQINGSPDMSAVSTSYVERQNLTMRMCMRRFTRLTNAFSKKVENHMHAIALHFMYYNFGRIHKSLKVTPAMQAGIADHAWSLEEIANLFVEKPKKRGSCKKKPLL